jgi:hypothetical protein
MRNGRPNWPRGAAPNPGRCPGLRKGSPLGLKQNHKFRLGEGPKAWASSAWGNAPGWEGGHSLCNTS